MIKSQAPNPNFILYFIVNGLIAAISNCQAIDQINWLSGCQLHYSKRCIKEKSLYHTDKDLQKRNKRATILAEDWRTRFKKGKS